MDIQNQVCPNCSSPFEENEQTPKQCLVCGRPGCSSCIGWRCSYCDEDYHNWRKAVVSTFPEESMVEKLMRLKLAKIKITNGKLEDWVNAGGVFKYGIKRRGIFLFIRKEHTFELAGWRYVFSQRCMAKSFQKRVTELISDFSGWPPENESRQN